MMMEEALRNDTNSDKNAEVQSRDVVRISSGKSSGDIPKYLEVKKSTSHKMKATHVNKEPFFDTMRKMRSFRRGVKKLWNIWSGFKKSTPRAPKKKEEPQTLGVPGYEEIACIDVEMPDIMITDRDRIRTSCKQCMENPPKFPTKEQVKSKLIAVDKYYGVNKFVKKRDKALERSDSLEHDADYFDDDGKVIRPSWRFILERPLVEQYVLMTNYIRKVSILSELQGSQIDQTIEDDESGSDTEYDKFTEKHKIETQQLLASMRAPRTKETAVQTSTKSLVGLVEPVSEISLYPDSGSSNESSQSKRELSAVTVIDSHDLSSPLQSDLDNRSTINGASVGNAVRWWESKEPPHTSESFQTSCDSAKDVAVGSCIPTIHNEQGKDWSGSGSDGTFHPIHYATGNISLIKLDAREKVSGGRIKGEQSITTPKSTEKGTTTKKVTFSPVVEYFNAPAKNNAIFCIPKQFEEENVESSRSMDSKLISLNEGQNRTPNKTFLNHSHDQKHIIIQLDSTPKEGNRGFSLINKFPLRDSLGVTSKYFQQQDTNKSAANDRKLLMSANKIPTRPFLADRAGGSSTEYRSSPPETVTALSSSDRQYSPQRTTNQVLSRHKKHSEESKESSSNSSERIALKPSPAVLFKPGDACMITQLATDEFYPEVPDIEEDEKMYHEERKDVCTFPGSPARGRNIEGHLDKSATNPGFVKFVILRGETPQNEDRANQMHLNNQQTKILNSPDTGGRTEPGQLQRRSNEQGYPRRKGLEQFYENYSKIVNYGQARYDGKTPVLANLNTKQTSAYSAILENLQSVASVPLNMDFIHPLRNHTNDQQPRIYPKITEHQREGEQRIFTTHQQKNANQDVPPKLSSGTKFLGVQEMKDCALRSSTESTKSINENEEQRKLKKETTHVDLQELGDCFSDRNIKITENNPEESPRTSVVTSSLTGNHVLRKISEELNYSSTDVRYDSLNPVIQIQNLESHKTVTDRSSYEDFSKFDVLKTSQIYSSSSSFVTPSEERMAFGLQVEGTIFQPMVVEDITPEVTMIPSHNERSTSLDVIASTKSTSKDLDEPEVNTCPPQEGKRETFEINYQPLTQIQYPTQFEMIIPSYTLIGNAQYATQNNVDIITDKIIYKETTIQDEEDNRNQVIESNIEYILQKVHENTKRQTNENQREVTNKNHVGITSKTSKVSSPKQWLMDIIPTVVKTSTKTPSSQQNSATSKRQLEARSNTTPNSANVKPVFKFLKKQKEMEENDK